MLGMESDNMNVTMTNKILALDKSIDLAYSNAIIWAQADEYTGGTMVNYIEAVVVNGMLYPGIVGYMGRGTMTMQNQMIEDGKLGVTFNLSLGNWKICQMEIPEEYLPDTTRSAL